MEFVEGIELVWAPRDRADDESAQVSVDGHWIEENGTPIDDNGDDMIFVGYIKSS